jgi:hypothetical protein
MLRIREEQMEALAADARRRARLRMAAAVRAEAPEAARLGDPEMDALLDVAESEASRADLLTEAETRRLAVFLARHGGNLDRPENAWAHAILLDLRRADRLGEIEAAARGGRP